MTAGAGRFIVVEGPDGSGKSSLVAGLAGRLRELGRTPVVVREPGGTPVAEALRAELLDRTRSFTPLGELLYITAARADLVHHVIAPALAGGQLVLSDRYDLSTRAYQVAGRGVDPATADLFNRAATGGLRPDLTIVLDIPPALGMARQREAGKRQDRLDLEEDAFQQRVAACYREASGVDIIHIDGTAGRSAVLDATWQALRERWPDIFS